MYWERGVMSGQVDATTRVTLALLTPRPERPSIPKGLRELIRRMACEHRESSQAVRQRHSS